MDLDKLTIFNVTELVSLDQKKKVLEEEEPNALNSSGIQRKRTKGRLSAETPGHDQENTTCLTIQTTRNCSTLFGIAVQKALTFVGSKISESLQYQIPNHTNHTKFAKFRRDLPLLGAGDSSWSVEGAGAGDPGEQGGGGREGGRRRPKQWRERASEGGGGADSRGFF